MDIKVELKAVLQLRAGPLALYFFAECRTYALQEVYIVRKGIVDHIRAILMAQKALNTLDISGKITVKNCKEWMVFTIHEEDAMQEKLTRHFLNYNLSTAVESVERMDRSWEVALHMSKNQLYILYM